MREKERWLQKEWCKKGGCGRDSWKDKSRKWGRGQHWAEKMRISRGGRRNEEKKKRNGREERRVWLERISGKEAFLGWLLKKKDSCSISCPSSWRVILRYVYCVFLVGFYWCAFLLCFY